MARYIDADKFLQDEIKRCGCVPLVGSCTMDNESLAYQLAKAPTADVVEVKHGEWIYNIQYYSCSVCAGKRFNLLLGTDSEFCPYCGARMDGRSDT